MTPGLPPAVLTHLWQSTMFGAMVWLLTLALRRHHPRVRYWLWVVASAKFLVPVAWLVAAGTHVEWRDAPAALQPAAFFVVERVLATPVSVRSTPGTPPSPAYDAGPVVVGSIWLIGVVVVCAWWWRQWLPVRAARRAAAPLVGTDAGRGLRLMSSPAAMGPGVVGVWRPVLLVPHGLLERLTPPQIEALVAHERSHVRHCDNLVACVHMAIEALFWFHPLVWWIERRLIDERERACDEEVLAAGHDAETYAEGILAVCRLTVRTPLVCVAGVAGSDLRRRIEQIMTLVRARELSAFQRGLLVTAAVAVVCGPAVAGLLAAPARRVQSAPVPKFDVVSIKPCQEPPQIPGQVGRPGQISSPGRLKTGCGPLLNAVGIGLISDAYATFADGHRNLDRFSTPFKGGPSWLRSAFYEVTATAEGNPSVEMMMGPMMQALLEERFHLKIRHELVEGPVYILSVARGGPKLRAFTEGSCVEAGTYPPTPLQAGQDYCRLLVGGRSPASVDAQGITLESFVKTLRLLFDRPVINRTGLAGRFDIKIEFSREGTAMAAIPLGGRQSADTTPSIFTVLQEQLGLKLESGEGPVDQFVIDSIERPESN